MSFDSKSAILKEINETNDPAMKTVLLLLLAVFEEIGAKIDNVLNNEQVLRNTVLNGIEPVHHKHHEWLVARINRDDDVRLMSSWVKVKMSEEALNRESRRKATDTVVIEIIKACVIGGGSIAAAKFFGF